MTIKNMSKLHKKICKLEALHYISFEALKKCYSFEYDKQFEHAQNLVKALKGLRKIADSMGVSVDLMTDYTDSEERFLRWMLIEGIEIHTNTEDETEEETEEDNDE